MYLTIEDKYAAIIEDIKETVAAGRPVLVGTASIESSEHLSPRWCCEVLIKYWMQIPCKEADIIAQAGRPGAITIATNMAGRGTDIMLGGNWKAEVAELENPTDAIRIKTAWQQRHDALEAVVCTSSVQSVMSLVVLIISYEVVRVVKGIMVLLLLFIFRR